MIPSITLRIRALWLLFNPDSELGKAILGAFRGDDTRWY